jgi:hypothetical protein
MIASPDLYGTTKHSIYYHTPPQTNTNNTKIYSFAVMSPCNEVFQAIPFDASSDANEPLIAAGDAEEEDHRLEEKAFFSRFKLFSLLLGLLVGFYFQLAFFFVETISGKDVATKSTTDIVAVSLIWTLLSLVMVFVVWEFLRNTMNYSAAGGRSKDLHMVCRFSVGALVGIYSAWIMTAVLMGTRVQIVYSSAVSLVVALLWYEITMMCFATLLDNKATYL